MFAVKRIAVNLLALKSKLEKIKVGFDRAG
jgi:hypothetical protein